MFIEAPPLSPTNFATMNNDCSEEVHSPERLPSLQGITDPHHLPAGDLEKGTRSEAKDISPKVSAFKSLGLLDRLLALWIFLAMLIGILLGNFVPVTGPALQKGKFVGVSIPIGASEISMSFFLADRVKSCWTACDDVPNSLQSQV